MNWGRSLSQLAVSLFIIGLGVLLAFIFYIAKPAVKKGEPEIKATLVEVIKTEPTSERIKITAYGTVQPQKQIVIHPEVSGSIIDQSPELKEGGLLKDSQIMLMIEPRDYELAVKQAEAEVTKAEFDLKVEKGRQIVAKREWELLDISIKTSEIGEELALRKPHLKEKKAALESAESRLEKTKLDLERTVLYAPFNAVVIEENTEVGQYINQQTAVATLAGSDIFEVRVSIPYEKLRWIRIPKNGQNGPKILITQDIGGETDIQRPGKLVRLLGSVDPQGRLARLVVAIQDPLGLKNGHYRSKPLLLGSYVQVDIFGPLIENVYKVPRSLIHEGNILWIKNKDNQLEFRKIHILYGDQENVFINKGLEPEEEIVTSPLPIAIPKMDLRTDGSES